ncbi:MAG: hypothetical protein COA81_11065 [Alphaproteobacteria bacterium]|nr:MAG: hypothetical protein COA81_11065 [Alphaproteobacteria bacterium]
MLESLTITNFKSIKNLPLSFGQVNIFIGGNGVGKSNILEAIGILSAGLSRDITPNELQRKGVRLSVPALFKASFKNKKLPKNLGLKATFSGDVHYNMTLTARDNDDVLRFNSEGILHKDHELMGRSNRGVKIKGLFKQTQKDLDKTRGLWDRFREVTDYGNVVNDELNEMRNYAIYSPHTAFLRGTAIESSLVSPLGLQGSNLPKAASSVLPVIKRLRRVVMLAEKDVDLSKNEKEKIIEKSEHFDDVLSLVWGPGWADFFHISPATSGKVSSIVKTGEETLFFRDRYMHGTRKMLSAYDSSEGTLYLLFLAVLLLHENTPNIFGIDNIDNALNPRMTREALEKIINFVSWCNQNGDNKQVFLTSHNPTALDAFDIFNDDQRIFIVSRHQDTGETVVTRLEPPEGMTKDKWINYSDGKNLSELWIEGRLPGDAI